MSCWWTILFSPYENLALEALKSLQQLLSVFHPQSQVLEHFWNRHAPAWSEVRERNGPSYASGPTWLHAWCVWASRGWGGWKRVSALPAHAHAQVLAARVLQPWANQLCEKGQASFLLKTWLLLYVPWWYMRSLPAFANAVNSANAAVITAKGCWLFKAPQEGLHQKYVFHCFCSIKSPSQSNLFSMQIGFAQLGKYWTSKFFLGNKFPLKSMRQASHLFLWRFVIY